MATSGPKRIQKLDEAVINRIAAGEVIQRPASALKEMLENSLDAGSTSIQVVLKNGGLKFLQITDNGHGIMKEDMPLVCERFATSKLVKFEDLQQVDTFGFRGEALASISMVAHVSITSMTQDGPCAYKAYFVDGKLAPLSRDGSAEPKPCAGVRGTQITVEDLFYNVPTRSKAIKNGSEEYARVLDVMQKYAVHNAGVSFTCKKHGETTADLHTPVSARTLDVIRIIHGAKTAKELVPVQSRFGPPRSTAVMSVEDEDEDESDPKAPAAAASTTSPTKEGKKLDGTCPVDIELSGYVSNANYNVKKGTMIFFINKRLVECQNIKKAIDQLYSAFLPKGTHPFVYLSLKIDPKCVDVNVHPTKKEVHFLHEDDIVRCIIESIESQLKGANTSRNFYTQAVLPGVSLPSPAVTSGGGGASSATTAESPSEKKSTGQRVRDEMPDHKLVRTTEDGVQSKLDAWAAGKRPAPSGGGSSSSASSSRQTAVEIADSDDFQDVEEEGGGEGGRSSVQPPKKKAKSVPPQEATSPTDDQPQLSSIQNLLNDVDKRENKTLTDILKHYTWVGWVNADFSLIQHQTRLLMINVRDISKELFYQCALRNFKKFKRVVLSKPIPVLELLNLAINHLSDDSPILAKVAEIGETKTSCALAAQDTLIKFQGMFVEYFQIEMRNIDGNLHLASLPQVIEGHMPFMDFLPFFILQLALVNYSEEQECLDQISREIAEFYALPNECDEIESSAAAATGEVPPSQSVKDHFSRATPESLSYITQHVILPTSRRVLRPPDEWAKNGVVVEVARLENLYKIFERC